MHPIFSRSVLLAALYVTTGCVATRAPETAPAAPPAAHVTLPGPTAASPAPVPVPAPAPAVVAKPLPAPAPGTVVPHIALILPLKSAALGHAAEVVQQGFMAAANVQPHALPVLVYDCADERKEIGAIYEQALASGAQAVVGGLTRDGAMALANQPKIPVPTLTLNSGEGKVQDKLYYFGLNLDSEARQVARLAASEDLHTASIVSTDTPLSRRLVAAFKDEWKKQGGVVVAERVFTGEPSVIGDLPLEPGSMVFVASNAEKARLFRPYINAALPVYATSQIFNGNTNMLVNYDLRDVQFVDMPWLLQTDHPAVVIYPRATPPLDIDMERIYALGIDAFRLSQIMLGNRYSSLPLVGVTGKIRLEANHQFQREGVEASFKQGLGLTPAAFAALNAARSGPGVFPNASAPASAPAASDRK